ncbi:hypothetical protein HZC34_06170 [Candidatus Saganbacteria bacterium]|nr:hypothetical protein [Candidatus Saganbacteria bacterium]
MKNKILVYSLLVVSCMFLLSAVSLAEIPRTINVQGRVSDKGIPISDGKYQMSVDFTDKDGNTIADGTEKIFNDKEIKNGMFNLQINLTGANDWQLKFDKPYWVLVELPNLGLKFLQPLTSVPYALNADSLGGLPATSYATKDASGKIIGASGDFVKKSGDDMSGVLGISAKDETAALRVTDDRTTITPPWFGIPFGAIAAKGDGTVGLSAYSKNNMGIYAKSDSKAGIFGVGKEAGVHGEKSNDVFGELGTARYFAGVYPPMGVFGTSTDIGIYGSVGESSKATTLSGKKIPSIGVAGWSPDGRGVSGGSSTGSGVYGSSWYEFPDTSLWVNNKDYAAGGYFEAQKGFGVIGTSFSNNGGNGGGVLGRSLDTNDVVSGFFAKNFGVAGISNKGNGVFGVSSMNDGIYGYSHDKNHAGVYATNAAATGNAIKADGKVQIGSTKDQYYADVVLEINKGKIQIDNESKTTTVGPAAYSIHNVEINKIVGKVTLNASNSNSYNGVTVTNGYVKKDSIILLTIFDSSFSPASAHDQALVITKQYDGGFEVVFRSKPIGGFNFLVIN